MAATFYQPAFAQLTATLAEHLSRRSTYAVLALILALVTIPAHALALRATSSPSCPS